MAEVPDYLVPTDGLTNSRVRFSGLDILRSGEQLIRFEMSNESQQHVANFTIEVGPSRNGNADKVIADGHSKMRDILRQWLYETDKLEQFYRRQAARGSADD